MLASLFWYRTRKRMFRQQKTLKWSQDARATLGHAVLSIMQESSRFPHTVKMTPRNGKTQNLLRWFVRWRDESLICWNARRGWPCSSERAEATHDILSSTQKFGKCFYLWSKPSDNSEKPEQRVTAVLGESHVVRSRTTITEAVGKKNKSASKLK